MYAYRKSIPDCIPNTDICQKVSLKAFVIEPPPSIFRPQVILTIISHGSSRNIERKRIRRMDLSIAFHRHMINIQAIKRRKDRGGSPLLMRGIRNIPVILS